MLGSIIVFYMTEQPMPSMKMEQKSKIYKREQWLYICISCSYCGKNKRRNLTVDLYRIISFEMEVQKNTPTVDDIGHVLRFECAAVDAETKLPVRHGE
ncbi:hypothetical protein FRX31_003020 [Thalictrum thalictroides]|uniref:Uncharacterized protein n=1 Tax=Thalictrum thalictroides TaxID=46969 RepID=A0A7J6XG22_THATH|nr:hypothetical protein FRX31_003020 [Thalictrum thalictroides]